MLDGAAAITRQMTRRRIAVSSLTPAQRALSPRELMKQLTEQSARDVSDRIAKATNHKAVDRAISKT